MNRGMRHDTSFHQNGLKELPFCWFHEPSIISAASDVWFSEHFSCQNLLRSLSRLLFLLRWNKYGAKKCLKNHIPFDFWDDSTSANQEAGKTIEKPLNELPWNQQHYWIGRRARNYMTERQVALLGSICLLWQMCFRTENNFFFVLIFFLNAGD